jgi:hypothetical protein
MFTATRFKKSFKCINVRKYDSVGFFESHLRKHTTMAKLTTFTHEVLRKIYKHLSQNDLRNMRRVCHTAKLTASRYLSEPSAPALRISQLPEGESGEWFQGGYACKTETADGYMQYQAAIPYGRPTRVHICRDVTITSATFLLQKFTPHTLTLRGCERITDVSALGGIRTLNLAGCIRITDV